MSMLKKSHSLGIDGQDWKDSHVESTQSLYIVKDHEGQKHEALGQEELNTLLKRTSAKEIYIQRYTTEGEGALENKLSFHGPMETKNSEFIDSLKQKVEKTSIIYNRFFSIQNNSEIFRIGKIYCEDIEMGMKYFCFSSDGNAKSLVKAQYGLVAFFNLHSQKTVTVLASAKEIGEWKKLCDFSEEKIIEDRKNGGSYKAWISEGIVLVDYFSFRAYEKKSKSVLVNELLSNSEISFCSLPSVKDLEKNTKKYFEIIQNVDSVTLIAQNGKTSLASMKRLVKRMKNYNVEIKGVLHE